MVYDKNDVWLRVFMDVMGRAGNIAVHHPELTDPSSLVLEIYAEWAARCADAACNELHKRTVDNHDR